MNEQEIVAFIKKAAAYLSNGMITPMEADTITNARIYKLADEYGSLALRDDAMSRLADMKWKLLKKAYKELKKRG